MRISSINLQPKFGTLFVQYNNPHVQQQAANQLYGDVFDTLNKQASPAQITAYSGRTGSENPKSFMFIVEFPGDNKIPRIGAEQAAIKALKPLNNDLVLLSMHKDD